MFDKADAIAKLVEKRLPLFTLEIRKALADINKGPPDPSQAVVLEIVKRYPDHFADLVYRKTNGHELRGKVVWTNPGSGHEFDDLHIQVICRYLRIAYQYEDYLEHCLPHKFFEAKYQRIFEEERARTTILARRKDAERFFSFPEAMASDECRQYWEKLSYLSSDECAALALGRDPAIVTLANVEDAVGGSESLFLNEYRNTKQMFERNRSRGTAGENRISKADFIRLTKELGFAVPKTKILGENSNIASISDTSKKEISTAAVHNLYRLILALAIKHYPGIEHYLDEYMRTGRVDRDPSGSVITKMERDLSAVFETINGKSIKEYLFRAYLYARNKQLLAAPGKTDG